MTINDIDTVEMGRQLRQPSGEAGKIVGESMNIANCSLYILASNLLKFNSGDKVLEIGFGNGKFFSSYFEMNPNIEVYGIDFSQTMCDEATLINKPLIDKKQLFLQCSDASNTSYQSNCFDSIITHNTIYFWNPFEKQLDEIRRILKPGGTLIIGFRPRSVMEKMSFTSEVFQMFELSEITETLKKHHFEIIDEKIQNLVRKTVDGNEINATDICVAARKY
jgi:ubiquinone/menaquinone biosynthesis C-methylase UbiE